MSRIKTDSLDQWHDYDVYTPARLISLSGEIDENSATQFIKNIRLMDHVTDQDITVLINTDGGSVHQGLAIFDAIKECNSKVITHAVGPCYSMGSIILCAGDYRKISANATVMIHIGSASFEEDHAHNIKRWQKEFDRIEELSKEILLNKIREKKPRFTKAALEKMMVFDTILTAEQVLEYGLANEIAEHKELLKENN